MVIASIKNIRYFLLILVVFIIAFGSTFFVLLHQEQESSVADTLKTVLMLLAGSNFDADAFDHLPHPDAMSIVGLVLYVLYWAAVGTTASTMVLALVSKSCDSSLHTEAMANYLQQLADFITEVELVSTSKLSKPQKERY